MTTPEFQPPEGFSKDDLFDDEQPSRRTKRIRKYARQRNKRKDFLLLPRPKRRKMTASIGWKIRSDANGRGMFTSHQVIPGSIDYPLEPGEKGAGWVDFYCRSNQPLRMGVFYNGYAKTVVMDVVDQMEKLAGQATKNLLSEEEKQRDRPRMFTKKIRIGSEVIFAPSPCFEVLGGMTTRGFSGQWLIDHLDRIDQCIKVCPHARLKTDYAYGVGLEMLVASPGITVDSLAQEIEKFYARGEISYEDDPIDLTPYLPQAREHLEDSAWAMLRADARARNLPDPTPAHVIARQGGNMHVVGVRL
jgi:hypothetical protein